MTVDRTIKSSQVVTPSGTGAIYDFGDESFVAMDTSHWKINNCRVIRLERLEKVLRVGEFREPPFPPQRRKPGAVMPAQSVPFMRFPAWLFCPQCRNMDHWKWNDEQNALQPSCGQCGPRHRLVPMRFISICENGHLSDVDWVRLAHSRPAAGKPRCEKPDLKFLSDSKKGGGLKSLGVQCKCGAFCEFEKLMQRDFLRQIGGKRMGKHPWQRQEDREPCDKVPQVVQRGSSNAYFPKLVAALDIRTEATGQHTENIAVKQHAAWNTLEQLYESANNPSMTDPSLSAIINLISIGVGVSPEQVWSVLHTESVTLETKETGNKDPEQLLREEWTVLQSPPEPSMNAPFVAERADLSVLRSHISNAETGTLDEFFGLVDNVVLAKRVRVVKALSGFSRLTPSGKVQKPALNKSLGWFPANEIYGEGIFVSLNAERLARWESRVPSSALAGLNRKRGECEFDFLPDVVTPRFLLLHTLSHLLIRQLCFECGYSSSSLAERIYCDESMAGILIYTASSDSEGAMGGLVREGEPNRFYSSFKLALYRAEWCSNDPICREMPHQGVRGLNKAACHACALLAETSCDHGNALLDRTVLFGAPDVPGFFEDFMRSMEW